MKKPLSCILRGFNPVVTNRIQRRFQRIKISEISEKISENLEISEASELAAQATSRCGFKMKALFLDRRQNVTARQRVATQSRP